MEAQILSDARLERLPIFPLQDVQLFPNSVLPLHVFEPRYVALVEHAMVSDGALAVATLVVARRLFDEHSTGDEAIARQVRGLLRSPGRLLDANL